MIEMFEALGSYINGLVLNATPVEYEICVECDKEFVRIELNEEVCPKCKRNLKN